MTPRTMSDMKSRRRLQPQKIFARKLIQVRNNPSLVENSGIEQ